MPRRYRRTELSVFERSAVRLPDFPSGEGPPLLLSGSFASWRGLGLDQRVLFPFQGSGGAYVHGLMAGRAVIWTRYAGEVAGAYCYHAPPGPIRPGMHAEALSRLNYRRGGGDHLYVVVASRSDVTAADEGFFLSRGVPASDVFTYSNAFLPQFGVSGEGMVGEVR